MPYEEIKQMMQMFVYEMTQMMVARGGQLVFSSVQLSPGVPDALEGQALRLQGEGLGRQIRRRNGPTANSSARSGSSSRR